MKMICCGVVYSTLDPETYWCIQKYNLKKNTKAEVDGAIVVREAIYVLTCKKNGCAKLELRRYGDLHENSLLEIESYSGQKALKFLKATASIRIRVSQKFPFQLVKNARRIPYVYGKAISNEKQRGRYFNEEGWSKAAVVDCPLKIYNI